MSNEERLQEAKRLFPIGTKFDNNNITKGCGTQQTIHEFSKIKIYYNNITVENAHPTLSNCWGHWTLYNSDTNKWAVILETPVPVNKEPSYEIY